MFYEVWIKKYGTFTIITEYTVFAGGHFENGLEKHFCNGNSTGDIFYIQKYHISYFLKLVWEDHEGCTLTYYTCPTICNFIGKCQNLAAILDFAHLGIFKIFIF